MTSPPDRGAPRRLRRAPRPSRAARRWTAVTAGVLALSAAGALVHVTTSWGVQAPGSAAAGGTAAAASAPAAGAGRSSSAQSPGGGPAPSAPAPSAPASQAPAGSGGASSPWSAAVQTSASGGVRSSAPDSAQAAGAALPVGDLAGWHQVFTDGFDTDVPEGSFSSSAYGDRWHAYDGFPDTFEVGAYSDDVLSVSGGALRMRWRTEGGVPLVSGIVPLVDGRWGGHVGGRYSVRFRSEAASRGYHAAFLAWPDSNVWDEGEIDFAEGALDGGVRAYHHCPGDPEAHCGSAETTAPWSEWHVATVEWTPSGVTYFLDGVRLMRSSDVPVDPMHLVLQGYVRPGWDATRDAVVQVDWVSIWYPDGT
ncbi:glycoside hydrolase family 16 protein [Streptomyces sp. NP160]|uniref:glycoside hydrolase family 16 protein n=1 Tax=Streptomyces sp. NP160 TaxID=2586637 RepID=UPI00111BB70C|nr:glycoside hydrolase family 16 protein [Streptomyces sp. NP160]TNM67477.1 glycoside hydrolase family 16 protein [Streptomyces sp. NP160]